MGQERMGMRKDSVTDAASVVAVTTVSPVVRRASASAPTFCFTRAPGTRMDQNLDM